MIDAAGPFQGADLSFARACIAAGVDYLDLADGRDFVAAFPALDADARAAGVRAVTGASSTPAITHAALDEMTRGWTRIDSIRAGISPGNRAPRGRSVVEAILSWTGAPVRVFENGEWRTRPGWSGTRKRQVAGLGRRRFALAETPDLDLLPVRYAPREEAVFMAGLELGLLHRGLGVLGAVRVGWVGEELSRQLGRVAVVAVVAAAALRVGPWRDVRRGVWTRRRRSPYARGVDASVPAGRGAVHTDPARAGDGAEAVRWRSVSNRARVHV